MPASRRPSSSTRARGGSRRGRTRSGRAARTISRIDPATEQIEPRQSAFWGPMAYGFGSLWVLGPELERLSPATMRASRPSTSRKAQRHRDGARRGLGRRRRGRGRSSRRPAGGGHRPHLRRRRRPVGVAVGADAVWAASEAGTVVRIDPRTDEVTDRPRRRSAPWRRRRRGRRLGLRASELTRAQSGRMIMAG